MTRIIGIAGSLRRQSFNLGLLRAAAELMPDGATLEVHTINDIPLYNADVEVAEGLPRAVTDLKDKIAAADGLLLATPEYNNGIPGVFKNSIDWLSRPASDIGRVFGAKPVAVIGASPGGFGTILAQNAWLGVLRTLGTKPWFEGRLLAARAGGSFDAEGRLTDDAVREKLAGFVAGFVAFIEEGRS
ncbi:NADPH-dependent FMN reductase [Sphingomonas alpina]|uniref:NAD(P)H-dependent oxidoreductase n=1 Tax=Sphingomonas alpina TaxID=653931 RepID=A0A7H0LM73_9SPHN|nr:NADPH-dependent FMN reductase [Sphingomonas alpina]QNQ10776.1 NAD(P)H-dependent oxidoreductase [Sphingomonas alpina]